MPTLLFSGQPKKNYSSQIHVRSLENAISRRFVKCIICFDFASLFLSLYLYLSLFICCCCCCILRRLSTHTWVQLVMCSLVKCTHSSNLEYVKVLYIWMLLLLEKYIYTSLFFCFIFSVLCCDIFVTKMKRFTSLSGREKLCDYYEYCIVVGRHVHIAQSCVLACMFVYFCSFTHSIVHSLVGSFVQSLTCTLTR